MHRQNIFKNGRAISTGVVVINPQSCGSALGSNASGAGGLLVKMWTSPGQIICLYHNGKDCYSHRSSRESSLASHRRGHRAEKGGGSTSSTSRLYCSTTTGNMQIKHSSGTTGVFFPVNRSIGDDVTTTLLNNSWGWGEGRRWPRPNRVRGAASTSLAQVISGRKRVMLLPQKQALPLSPMQERPVLWQPTSAKPAGRSHVKPGTRPGTFRRTDEFISEYWSRRFS